MYKFVLNEIWLHQKKIHENSLCMHTFVYMPYSDVQYGTETPTNTFGKIMHFQFDWTFQETQIVSFAVMRFEF